MDTVGAAMDKDRSHHTHGSLVDVLSEHTRIKADLTAIINKRREICELIRYQLTIIPHYE